MNNSSTGQPALEALDPQRLKQLEVALVPHWENAGQPPLACERAQDAAAIQTLLEIDAELQSACCMQVSEDFTVQVMRKLHTPQKAVAVRTFVAAPRASLWQRGTIAVALGLTASIVLFVGVLFLHERSALEVPLNKVQMRAGQLMDSKGRTVAQLKTAQRYKVAQQIPVVLQTETGGVRLMPNTKFELKLEVPNARGTSTAIRLLDGSLYALDRASHRLTVEAPTFETSMFGESYIYHAADDPRDHWGQGLVVVFRGSAWVRSRFALAPVELKEGEIYLAGMEAESLTSFLDEVEERARDLDTDEELRPANTQAQQYRALVKDYRERRRILLSELKNCNDQQERSAISERLALVEEYLERHERRLAALTPSNPRAQKLRRAAKSAREGVESYRASEDWL